MQVYLKSQRMSRGRQLVSGTDSGVVGLEGGADGDVDGDVDGGVDGGIEDNVLVMIRAK